MTYYRTLYKYSLYKFCRKLKKVNNLVPYAHTFSSWYMCIFMRVKLFLLNYRAYILKKTIQYIYLPHLKNQILMKYM